MVYEAVKFGPALRKLLTVTVMLLRHSKAQILTELKPLGLTSTALNMALNAQKLYKVLISYSGEKSGIQFWWKYPNSAVHHDLNEDRSIIYYCYHISW